MSWNMLDLQGIAGCPWLLYSHGLHQSRPCDAFKPFPGDGCMILGAFGTNAVHTMKSPPETGLSTDLAAGS